MKRQFVIGDIHGAYRALIQCLERSEFDRDRDELICLGDVCDGWPETSRCVDELLRVRHLIYISGNHDTWLLKWMNTGDVENIWYVQGGEATILSYAGMKVPAAHQKLLQEAQLYHISDNRLFVHAGIIPGVEIQKQDDTVFLWDRMLARLAMKAHLAASSEQITRYREVYIGHTPIPYDKPVRGGEVWMMDTGAGWSGVLSMMNIETKEVFTSERVPDLYPGVSGRERR